MKVRIPIRKNEEVIKGLTTVLQKLHVKPRNAAQPADGKRIGTRGGKLKKKGIIIASRIESKRGGTLLSGRRRQRGHWNMQFHQLRWKNGFRAGVWGLLGHRANLPKKGLKR